MELFQYDLRYPAAEGNSITLAAVAPSNLDAAITMRSAETELQNTIELRATASKNCSSNLDAKTKNKTIFEALFESKGMLKGKSPSPKLRKSADKSISQP